MITILFIINYFSGLKTYSEELINRFLKMRSINLIEIHIGDLSVIELNIVYRSRNHMVVYIPCCKINNHDNKFAKHAALLIYNYCNRISNIILHYNAEDQFFFVKYLKKYLKIPTVFTLHFLESYHSFIEYSKKSYNDIVTSEFSKLNQLLLITDHIICVTKFTKYAIQRKYRINPNRITVIYNGIQKVKTKLRSNLRINAKLKFGFGLDDQVLLYVGPLEPRKGIDSLIKAFLLLKNKYLNLKLVIIGSGDYGKYIHIAKECMARIIFAGQLDKRTINLFYRFADIGVLSSQFEQCSYSVIEMMHNCIPLVISNTPGLNELITHNRTGLVCKMRIKEGDILSLEANEHDLAKKIELLMENKELAKNLSNEAKRYAEERLNIDIMCKDTIKVYEKLLKKQVLNNQI